MWKCSGKGERSGYERCGFEVQVRSWVVIFLFFWIETLSMTKKFLSVLKMAATVYERDNCCGDPAYNRPVLTAN